MQEPDAIHRRQMLLSGVSAWTLRSIRIVMCSQYTPVRVYVYLGVNSRLNVIGGYVTSMSYSWYGIFYIQCITVRNVAIRRTVSQYNSP